MNGLLSRQPMGQAPSPMGQPPQMGQAPIGKPPSPMGGPPMGQPPSPMGGPPQKPQVSMPSPMGGPAPGGQPPSPMPGQGQPQQDPVQQRLQMYEQRIAQLERMLMGNQQASSGAGQIARGAPRQAATSQGAQQGRDLMGANRMNPSSQNVFNKLAGG